MTLFNPARRAFTLVEVLVVVTLLIVVLSVAAPAFRGMIDASERSMSENGLRVAVQVARDLASRGEGDAAVVFFRDLDGRTRMVPALHVGTLRDAAVNPASLSQTFEPGVDPTIERDVFAPIAVAAPIQMPKGWAVAGYADPNTIDQCFQNCGNSGQLPFNFEGWYDSNAYGDNGLNTGDEARLDGNWVLPETAYFEMFMQAPGASEPNDYSSDIETADTHRTPRQTFMVRFESGTGDLVRGAAPALVIDPRPTSLGRGDFPQGMRWARANRIEDARSWTERVINTDDIDSDTDVDGDDGYFRTLAIGNFSNDTVLAGPVARLALYREEDLARGLGAKGLNSVTNSLYAPVAQDGRIAFDLAGLFPSSHPLISDPGDVRIAINRWMQGDTNSVAAGDFEHDPNNDGNVYGDAEADAGGVTVPEDRPMAKLFFVQHGTGELTEVVR